MGGGEVFQFRFGKFARVRPSLYNFPVVIWKLLKFELDRVSTIDSGIGQLFFIVRIISCLIIV